MHLEFGQTGPSEATALTELDRLGCLDPTTLFPSIGKGSCPYKFQSFLVPDFPIARDP